MLATSTILLVTGVLVLVSILGSRLSDRIGIPALITFLIIGMLAGSDGPGGIHFDNAAVANMIGTIALAYILFSGGLDTNWRIIRPVLARGVVLSTAGVAITAGLVGLFAWSVLGFNLLTGLLLGSIISSTDAAAVFSVLRGRGVGLKGNLKPLLELESGSNDPMAVFLTLGVTTLLTQPDTAPGMLAIGFVLNMAGGLGVGVAAGKLGRLMFNRVRLDYEGLYPVLSMSIVLLTFGAAEAIRGNGFLAVYVCGLMLNGGDFAYKRYVAKFHDGLAWMMQIAMFLVLGLLVFPSQLPAVAGEALLVAVFLMFVARPVAVALGLWGSEFNLRERALIAWTGLRGAVPIVLATFPLLAGYENSPIVFNVVFFTVLTSVAVQGTMLMPMARWLKVDEPLASRQRFSLEIQQRGLTQGETREVEIQPNTAAVGRRIADLDIPPDVLILLIGRGDSYVVPRGKTIIEPYDTILMLGKTETLREAVNAVLSPKPVRRRVFHEEDPLAELPMSTDRKFLSKQVVVVGHGRVGRTVCEILAAREIPFIVVEEDRKIVEQLRARDIPAVAGDASQVSVLVQAHVPRAAILVLATPDTLKIRTMADLARQMNPTIEIIIRTHSDMEASLFEKEGAGTVFLGERELAKSMARFVITRLEADNEKNSELDP